ncbi:MAG: sensor domain-containing diguanylate cyclase [Eubacteriales bacterium]
MILDENQYKIIVDFSPNMIWRSGTDSYCNYFNKTWLDFTGRTIEQEVGNGWAEGVHPDDFEFCVGFYMASFNKQEPFEMNYRLKRNDGQWRWINDRGVPFFNEDKVFQGYIGSCMDITNQVLGEELKTMARTDGLTGINNRQYFMQLAAEEFEKAHRYHSPFCLVMIDIDNFKSINDSYGHLAGDEVLRHFSHVLFQDIRKFDVAGRYGGDEFILIFPNTDMMLAVQIMKRIEHAMQSPIELPDKVTLAITISYGISQMQEEDSLESLIKKADLAMYLMKRSGK